MKKTFLILFLVGTGHVFAHAFKTATYRPNPLLTLLKKKNESGKKAIAAVLAFPLPFGVIGLHRIYLGTKPYIPLVYIGTLGGAAGILPFIDFWVILCHKDLSVYQENPRVFMWIEHTSKNEIPTQYD
ncbi:MAG: TM2 domain-containing protein [Bacteroidetes bacterium]|nr:TM2 domain-containing protein [Bacteroidota bacterium]